MVEAEIFFKVRVLRLPLHSTPESETPIFPIFPPSINFRKTLHLMSVVEYWNQFSVQDLSYIYKAYSAELKIIVIMLILIDGCTGKIPFLVFSVLLL